MSIFSKTITPGAAYPAVAAPDVEIPWQPKRVTIINNDPAIANKVLFSYDGAGDDGQLTPTINGVYESRQAVQKIWFKKAAGAPTVTVIAES